MVVDVLTLDAANDAFAGLLLYQTMQPKIHPDILKGFVDVDIKEFSPTFDEVFVLFAAGRSVADISKQLDIDAWRVQ